MGGGSEEDVEGGGGSEGGRGGGDGWGGGVGALSYIRFHNCQLPPPPPPNLGLNSVKVHRIVFPISTI